MFHTPMARADTEPGQVFPAVIGRCRMQPDLCCCLSCLWLCRCLRCLGGGYWLWMLGEPSERGKLPGKGLGMPKGMQSCVGDRSPPVLPLLAVGCGSSAARSGFGMLFPGSYPCFSSCSSFLAALFHHLLSHLWLVVFFWASFSSAWG